MEGIYGVLLRSGQRGRERELLWAAWCPFVGQFKAAAGLFGEGGDPVGKSARQDEPAIDVSS